MGSSIHGSQHKRIKWSIWPAFLDYLSVSCDYDCIDYSRVCNICSEFSDILESCEEKENGTSKASCFKSKKKKQKDHFFAPNIKIKGHTSIYLSAQAILVVYVQDKARSR